MTSLLVTARGTTESELRNHAIRQAAEFWPDKDPTEFELSYSTALSDKEGEFSARVVVYQHKQDQSSILNKLLDWALNL